MNGRGDKGQGDIIGAIIGIVVSFFIIYVFWLVISQLNFWFGILFLFTAMLIIAGAVLSILRR